MRASSERGTPGGSGAAVAPGAQDNSAAPQVTWNLADEVTGNLADEVTGNLADEVAGNLADEVTGNLADEVAGNLADEVSPPPAATPNPAQAASIPTSDDEDSPTVAETPASEPAPPGFAAEITDDLVTDAAEALRLIRDPEPWPSLDSEEGISLEDLGITPTPSACGTPANSSGPAWPARARPATSSPPVEFDDEDTVSDQPLIRRAADAPSPAKGDTHDLD